MISSAHTPDRPGDIPDLVACETHPMSARHPFVVDSYAMLDHRTRQRTVAAAGAPPGRYLAVEHAGETRLLAIERPITHIGRGLIADVRLEDSHVSRRHAIVALRGDGARVLDDRSANGTFVNGRTVTVAQLADGDALRFGRAVVRYVEIGRPRRPDPPRRLPLARRARGAHDSSDSPAPVAA